MRDRPWVYRANDTGGHRSTVNADSHVNGRLSQRAQNGHLVQHLQRSSRTPLCMVLMLLHTVTDDVVRVSDNLHLVQAVLLGDHVKLQHSAETAEDDGDGDGDGLVRAVT